MRKLGVAFAALAFSIVSTTTAVRASIIDWGFTNSSVNPGSVTGHFEWDTNSGSLGAWSISITSFNTVTDQSGIAHADSVDIVFSGGQFALRLDFVTLSDLSSELSDASKTPLGTLLFSPIDGDVRRGDFKLIAGTTAVPGPIAGAGLPGLIAAGAAFLAWKRRRR